MFRPFKGEFLDVHVTGVNALGFFCSLGVFEIFISRHNMSDEIKKFDNIKSAWCSEDGQDEIKPGTGVRINLISVNTGEGSKLTGIGSMKGHCCGIIVSV